MARAHQLTGRPPRPAVAVAVAASLALHALWLAATPAPATPGGPGDAGSPARPAAAAHAVPAAVAAVVRLVAMAPAPASTVGSDAAPPYLSPPTGTQTDEPVSAPAMGPPDRAAAALASVPASMDPRPALSTLSLPLAAPRGEPAWDAYLAREALTRVPAATDAVLLPMPETLGTGHWRGVLTLFIDEAGQVRRVRPELGSNLPPTLEDAARQAFMATRFAPGEAAGRPVKARIQVEVEFVADEPPRSAGAPGSGGGL